MTDRIDRIEAPEPLLAILADGEWHRGPALAEALGISRAAVSARIARLRATGVDVFSVHGKGYRLPAALDLIAADALRAALGPRATAMLDQLIVLQQTDSTNTRLAGFDDGATRACVAEQQSAGRGRAGRDWVSPLAANLYLSVGHQLAAGRTPLGALGLAIGVAVAETLAALGLADIALKWPNDLWIGNAKLGGLLIEARSEATGVTRLVAGLGLNLWMSRESAAGIDQPWTRLADHLWPMPARSLIAGRCLDAMLGALDEFAAGGFAPFVSRWSRFDLTADRRVDVVEGSVWTRGIARGVRADGSLVVEIEGCYRAFYSGDVSLRPV